MKHANVYKVRFYAKPKKAKPNVREEVIVYVWRKSAKAALNGAWDWQYLDENADFTATVLLEAREVDEDTWNNFKYFQEYNDGKGWKAYERYGDPALP